jgi:hypothetical protein
MSRFYSLWNFIHNLFLSLMSGDDQAAPTFVFLERDRPFHPVSFYSRVCDVPSTNRAVFVVTEIRWCKERSGKEHEYLAVQLQRRGGFRVFFAVVERGPSASANVFQASSTSLPSSISKQVSASDRISCLNQEDCDRRVNRDILLATYTFPGPGLPLLEFSRLVKIVSEYSENYQLNSTMCYWFSAMVMEISRRQFFPRDQNNRPVPAGLPKGAGYYKKILSTSSPQWTKDFDIIEQKYKDDKSADPVPISRQQQEAERKVQEARAEVRAEE